MFLFYLGCSDPQDPFSDNDHFEWLLTPAILFLATCVCVSVCVLAGELKMSWMNFDETL